MSVCPLGFPSNQAFKHKAPSLGFSLVLPHGDSEAKKDLMGCLVLPRGSLGQKGSKYILGRYLDPLQKEATILEAPLKCDVYFCVLCLALVLNQEANKVTLFYECLGCAEGLRLPNTRLPFLTLQFSLQSSQVGRVRWQLCSQAHPSS